MATIVGIEGDFGTVLAGDRRLTAGGSVASEAKPHVFDFGAVGAAAVGDSGSIDEFWRRLDSKVRSYETERGESMRLGRLASVASDLAAEAGVEAIVATRDEEGVARVRGIGADGGVITDATLAFGSGEQLALGVLEGRGEGIGLDEAEDLARKAIETVAERDTGTGEEIDTYRLASDPERE